MRNQALHIVASAFAAGFLVACVDGATDPAPSEHVATPTGDDDFVTFVETNKLKTWDDVRPLVVAQIGEELAAELEVHVYSDDPVGWIPEQLLPVVLPNGWVEVPEDTFERIVSKELTADGDFDGWVAAGMFDPRDADQARRAADQLGVAPPIYAADPDTYDAVGPDAGCGTDLNCKVVLKLVVTKKKTTKDGVRGWGGCGQYDDEYYQFVWDGAEANFEASGGTIWRNNAFADDYCLYETPSKETGKHEVTGTVVMTTEAKDPTKPKKCPDGLVAGVNLWGEAHQTAELSCLVKSAGSYGFSSSSSEPWDCYATGGVGCSVSGVGEQQLIATVEHKPDCTETNAISVNAKWTQKDGWELGGGTGSETACKKNLGSESRGVVDCQIVRGPDIAWKSDAVPQPTVWAHIGGKTFKAKAKSLRSWRAGFFSAAQRIRSDATVKTTANSAKVNIAGNCNTNNAEVPCEVQGTKQDGY